MLNGKDKRRTGYRRHRTVRGRLCVVNAAVSVETGRSPHIGVIFGLDQTVVPRGP